MSFLNNALNAIKRIGSVIFTALAAAGSAIVGFFVAGPPGAAVGAGIGGVIGATIIVIAERSISQSQSNALLSEIEKAKKEADQMAATNTELEQTNKSTQTALEVLQANLAATKKASEAHLTARKQAENKHSKDQQLLADQEEVTTTLLQTHTRVATSVSSLKQQVQDDEIDKDGTVEELSSIEDTLEKGKQSVSLLNSGTRP